MKIAFHSTNKIKLKNACKKQRYGKRNEVVFVFPFLFSNFLVSETETKSCSEFVQVTESIAEQDRHKGTRTRKLRNATVSGARRINYPIQTPGNHITEKASCRERE